MEPIRRVVVTPYERGSKKAVLCAVLEDHSTVELSLEPMENPSLLGNIYIGKVKNIAPQIGAAFVEVENGILCYYSLDDNESPIFVNRRHSNTKKTLTEGDELLVQVSREALKTKAPAVTCNLTFSGKYLVLTSANTNLGISNKLSKGERERLKEILVPFLDGSFGLIARTNAQGAGAVLLQEEFQRLKTSYEDVLKKGKSRTCFSRISQKEPGFLSMLKRVPKDSLSEILTDDPVIYEKLQSYLTEQQPEDLVKLRLYDERRLPLYKLYNFEKTLEDALSERVWLKSGGYLIIQPTEALTVIDVNTGKFEGSKQKQTTFLKINKEAAIETAKQIRLRNLSGIVIVDFIDMERQEDRENLMELLNLEFKKDPVKTLLVDITKLHLVEITRKKERMTLKEQYLACFDGT